MNLKGVVCEHEDVFPSQTASRRLGVGSIWSESGLFVPEAARSHLLSEETHRCTDLMLEHTGTFPEPQMVELGSKL